jgi:hypothetical protein
MVHVLSAALLFAAVSLSASAAMTSFEVSAAQVQASIATLRGAQVRAKAGASAGQISNLTGNLNHYANQTRRLYNTMRWLQQRMRAGGAGRSSSDPVLRWDVQRFMSDLSQLTRDAQWRLNDLRFLTASAEKDETLVAPASRLLDAARGFKSEMGWLAADARLAAFEFRDAGFIFESMDLDRDSRDLEGRTQDLQNEAARLLAKVRP